MSTVFGTRLILKKTMTMTKAGAFLLGLCSLLCACTETTGTLGIIETGEELSTVSATFHFTSGTDSLYLDQLPYNSQFGCIGAIRDPETGGLIESSFATQFVTQSNFKLPDESLMKKVDGHVVCDSMELILFMNQAYGDLDNAMKMEVYGMQSDRAMLNSLTGITFPEEKVADFNEHLGSRMFTFYDRTLPADELQSSTHQHAIRVPIDAEIGTQMMMKYYEHPEWFRDNNLFHDNVFPGVYCRLSESEGTMVNVAVSALDVNFVYKKDGKDKEGFVRFGATPEVFQCTRVENPKSRKKLCEVPDTTYLKNPDGVITYINLPVDEMLKGHEQDSISMCALTLQAYSKTDDAFDAPSQLLLVPHALRYTFFTENWNKDDRFFYITSYNATTNAYVFSNISRLVKGLKLLKDMGISTDEDWERVDVIPVSTTSDGSTYTSIFYDVTPTSVRLVCGTDDKPLDIQVVYSYFNR